MKKDINDFITILRLKNGKVKITHNGQNQANIYNLLHEFGYRISKLDNKRIYYLRIGTNIKPSNLDEMKDAFVGFLRMFQFTNMPDDLIFSDVMNWYHEHQPIKENLLFNRVLSDNLTETEVHNVRLQTDHSYKHRFEVNQLLTKFEEWKFDKTIDAGSMICKNAPLYYKNIGTKKYLIFTHYNSRSKSLDGFDSWIASFPNVKNIGNKKPTEIQQISLSFQLDRDYELIKEYV